MNSKEMPLINRQVKQITSEINSCSIDDDDYDDKTIIATQLKLLDIHFNWNLQQTRPITSETLVPEFDRKLKEMLDNSEFTFKSFCCQLTMAQELIKYDTGGALAKVLECEPWVESLKSDMCLEHEYASISEALEYIYLGCKAFALFKCGSIAETKKVLLQVPDLQSMDEKQISGIYGVKACAFMEYGLQGFLKALEYISIARSKYPMMAEWHFLTGKVMSRIRHVKYAFMTVSDEEENFFRTAYNMNQNDPSYALYMAQIKREKANGLYFENCYDREAYNNCKAYIDKMNGEALALYTKLIESHQNDSYILGRCAFGMMKLPEPFKRIDLAVRAFDQALKVSPDNPIVNHYAGLINHRYLKDNMKALEYLDRAASKGDYPARLDWLKVKYEIDPENFDPIPELEKGLGYNDFTSITLATMASWHLFNRLDVFSAWNHLKKIIDDDYPAKNHKSPFLYMMSKCDLFEVIFDEVKMKLAEGKYRNEQEKETLVSMSEELQVIRPQLHPTDYRNLKSIILNQSLTKKLKNEQKTRQSERSRAGVTQSYMRTDTGITPFTSNWHTNTRSDRRSGPNIQVGRKITDPWRETHSTGQERFVRDRTESSNSKVGRKITDPWRETHSTGQERFIRDRTESCNSRGTMRSECDSPHENNKPEPSSLEQVSSRNDSGKNLSSDWNPRRNKKPLYFPKSGSQASNFTNNRF